MRDRSHSRLTRLFEWTPDGFWPDAIDETVVHEPCGRPWLVCTSDRRWQAAVEPAGEVVYPDDLSLGPEADDAAARYETQVFYTARAGVRGLPTGHGERFATR